MTNYRRQTRTRELYDREHLSDVEVYTSVSATWREYIAWDDLEYSSARATMDYRPLEALLVQQGLINIHPFSTVF